MADDEKPLEHWFKNIWKTTFCLPLTERIATSDMYLTVDGLEKQIVNHACLHWCKYVTILWDLFAGTNSFKHICPFRNVWSSTSLLGWIKAPSSKPTPLQRGQRGTTQMFSASWFRWKNWPIQRLLTTTIVNKSQQMKNAGSCSQTVSGKRHIPYPWSKWFLSQGYGCSWRHSMLFEYSSVCKKIELVPSLLSNLCIPH